MNIKKVGVLCLPLAGLLLFPAEARADHVVQIDFGGPIFGLSWFAANGATCSSLPVLEDLILQEVASDMGRFEVTVTREQPVGGHYSRVVFTGNELVSAKAPYAGLSHEHAGWAVADELLTEIVLPNIALDYTSLYGSDGTCARIANVLSRIISHELGHNLGMWHENAMSTCPGGLWVGTGPPMTSDPTYYEHLGANLKWGTILYNAVGVNGHDVYTEGLASIDGVYNPACSGAIIEQEVKPRSWHRSGGQFLGGTETDLLVAEVFATHLELTFLEVSAGTLAYPSFSLTIPGPESEIRVGDINGDGWDDILVGEVVSGSSSLLWHLYRNDAGLGTFTYFVPTNPVWGDVGDRIRVGDVNGDGRDDLVLGEYDEVAGGFIWSVRLTDDIGDLDPASRWTGLTVGIGDYSDYQFLADVDGDSLQDLVNIEAIGLKGSRKNPHCDRLSTAEHADLALRSVHCLLPSEPDPSSEVDIYWHQSSGSSFSSALVTWNSGFAGYRTSNFYPLDWDGDGDVDLVQQDQVVSHGALSMLFGYETDSSAALIDRGPFGPVLPAHDLSTRFKGGDTDGDGDMDMMVYTGLYSAYLWTWSEYSNTATFAAGHSGTYMFASSVGNMDSWYY